MELEPKWIDRLGSLQESLEVCKTILQSLAGQEQQEEDPLAADYSANQPRMAAPRSQLSHLGQANSKAVVLLNGSSMAD